MDFISLVERNDRHDWDRLKSIKKTIGTDSSNVFNRVSVLDQLVPIESIVSLYKDTNQKSVFLFFTSIWCGKFNRFIIISIYE